MAFRDGRLPKECMWKMEFIIPKGDGEFRWIRLVGVLWKSFPGMTNLWIGAAVQFHDVLHGFWDGWGTGTASF